MDKNICTLSSPYSLFLILASAMIGEGITAFTDVGNKLYWPAANKFSQKTIDLSAYFQGLNSGKHTVFHMPLSSCSHALFVHMPAHHSSRVFIYPRGI
jgi:hypothetical protein